MTNHPATPRGAVSARQGAEELIDDRYLLDTFLEQTPDHVYFKDAESRFIRISVALARWLGLADAAEAIGRTDFDFFTPEHANKAFEDERSLLRTGTPLVAVEERETWQDGRETWVSTTKVPVRDRDGRIVGLFGVSRDVTERKAAEQRLALQAEQLAEQASMLERLASLDELTGLYNRRGLSLISEKTLNNAHAAGELIAIVFIDLDGLKEINDKHGHSAGDEALQTVAGVLRQTARDSDVLARIGGDEFCVLASSHSNADLDALPGRLVQALSEVTASHTTPYRLSVSVGSAIVDPRVPATLDELISGADQAMYRHKRRLTSAA